MSSLFLRWFLAVLTTSFESQAINDPEGARALFIVWRAAAEISCFFAPWAGARAAEIGLGWIMRLSVLLSIAEGLVRCDGVKVEPCWHGLRLTLHSSPQIGRALELCLC